MNTTVFNKKNKLLIPIILILLIPAVFAIYFAFNPGTEEVIPDTIVEIRVQYEGLVDEIIADKEAIQQYKDALVKNVKPASAEYRDLSTEIPFTISLVGENGNEPMVYRFYLKNDSDECIYVNPEGEYFLFDVKEAVKLLSRDEFKLVNKTATCPYATAGIDGVLLAPTSGEWNYLEADGKFHAERIDGSVINSTPVRINANNLGTLNFLASSLPDAVNVTLSFAGAQKHNGAYENMLNANVMAANDTFYDMVITAEWNQKEGCEYYGKLTYIVQMFYDVSPTYAVVGTSGIAKGDFGVITIDNFNAGEKLYVSSEFGFPTELQVFKNATGKSFAFLPVEYWNAGAIGTYDVTLSTADGASQVVKVKIKDSPALKPAVDSQNMLITDIELADHFSEEAFAQFYNLVAEKTAVTDASAMWTDKFVYPNADNSKARGEGMADCGTLRTVNAGGQYTNSYYHNGVDIGMAPGANVLAANNGKVVFAGELTLTGNTVIIDHGCSLLSYYGHLGSISVKEGDIVSKSAPIGTAGSTGFAVAANGASGSAATQVHFAISMEGKFVVPKWLVEYGVVF